MLRLSRLTGLVTAKKKKGKTKGNVTPAIKKSNVEPGVVDELKDDDHEHNDETEDPIGLESRDAHSAAGGLKSVGAIVDLLLLTSEKIKIEVIALVLLFFRRHYFNSQCIVILELFDPEQSIQTYRGGLGL